MESNTVYYEQTNISGSLDSDRDGVNDIADNDDDNDGIPDGQDSWPLGPDAPQTPQSIFNNLLDTVRKPETVEVSEATPDVSGVNHHNHNSGSFLPTHSIQLERPSFFKGRPV